MFLWMRCLRLGSDWILQDEEQDFINYLKETEASFAYSNWSKERKCKKVVRVALKIAVNRRQAKGKREKERYTHLNVEFQRIARTDKKDFLSDQYKEIEENNRMGKTRDLVKKIRDTKGAFHAKIGTVKDRNGMELTETESIKKWQEYTEELYKKGLHNSDNHDGVITHLDPDFLECKVKKAWGRITMKKASGGVGIPAELFQILKKWCC